MHCLDFSENNNYNIDFDISVVFNVSGNSFEAINYGIVTTGRKSL